MKSFDIEPICIYSDPENKMLCEKFGFESYEFPNEPLGAKFNFGIEKALTTKWDYLMQTNSDDLIKEELLELYQPYLWRKEQCFGVGEVYYYDLKSGRVAYVDNPFPLGCARMIHRDVITSHNKVEVKFTASVAGQITFGKGAKTELTEKQAQSYGETVKIIGKVENFKLYTDNKNRVLDFDSDSRLAKIGVNSVKVPCDKKILVVDMKSDVNIWFFEWFEDSIIEVDILKHFPERNEIRKLRQVYSH